jgi:hypothetical protein
VDQVPLDLTQVEESSVSPEVLPIVPSQDNKFKVEINLGLALPFRSYKRGSDETDGAQKSVVKSVGPDGSLYRVEIETKSEEGPLGGLDNDVLTVLLTMAWEQRDYKSNQTKSKGFRVYYTVTEVCRRLKLSENSRNKVKKSIEKIKSQKLNIKNFIYNKSENKAVLNDEETRIILKSGRVRAAQMMDEDESDIMATSYVEFDEPIIKNLHNEYFSVINQKDYLALSSGSERRVIIYLQSKRKKFGDEYAFELTELANVLGLSESKKKGELIKKFMQKVKDKIGLIDFSIKKIRGKDEWNVFVEFKSDRAEIDNFVDPFYASLVSYFGEDKLRGLDVAELDIENWRQEFSGKFKRETGKDEFIFSKENLNPAEFCIDVTLYQILKKGYVLKTTFKALARSILTSMIDGFPEIPDGYRSFIHKRMESEKKEIALKKMTKEVELKKKQEVIEAKRMEDSFNEMYDDLLIKNKGFMRDIEKRAKESIGEDESAPLYSLMLENKMREIAREDFENGESFDFFKDH